MQQLEINGGRPLNGETWISGSKNSVLPILAASLLVDEPVIIKNVPCLQDVKSMIDLLRKLGVKLINNKNTIKIDSNYINNFHAPYELVCKMRASILVLGPLLARHGTAVVSLPGGCAIGSRPVNLHTKYLKAMGAKIVVNNGYIEAKAQERLQATEIYFDTVTVTGTENIIMAATLAKGTTILRNAACEPEIKDLILFLNNLGAKITGAGTNFIKIEGVDRLFGGEYSIIADRIETGTFLVAGAITCGHIKVHHTMPENLSAVLQKLEESGAEIKTTKNSIELNMHGQKPNAVNIKTAPFPGFPTDMQSQFTVLNAIAKGISTITETIFKNRFMHIKELQRMGANIVVHGNKAICQGVSRLNGTTVVATDLRASASLVLAGLIAQGKTIVDCIYHIDRGYEHIEKKLIQLGADITRIDCN